MPPIRQSNRALKPKVHWKPPTTTPYRWPPVFTIYTDPPAPLGMHPLGMQPLGEPYQPQNLPKDTTPIKLFQLFFIVKEIENIVKYTNSQAAHRATRAYYAHCQKH
jgi:hypothetical protein